MDNIEFLKRLHGLGFNLMVFREDKTPLVSDYANYLERKKRLSIDTIIEYYQKGYLIAKIEGELYDKDITTEARKIYSFSIEAENNKVKHNQEDGIGIEVTYTILKKFLQHYHIPTDTWVTKTMHDGYRYNYITNAIIKNKEFQNIGIEIIGNKKASIFLGGNYQNYNEIIASTDAITTVDSSMVERLAEGLELLDNIVKALRPYYNKGSRDILCLSLAGYLRKAGYDINFAKLIVECVCIIFKDEEKEVRIKQCVEQTYKKQEENVSAYTIAKNISEDLAKELNKIFYAEDDKNKLISELKVLAKTATRYDLVLGVLRHDLDHGRKEAEFLRNYIFVKEEYATKEECKGNWYKWVGYCWKEVNYNDIIIDLTEYVRKKIEILLKEKEEDPELKRLRIQLKALEVGNDNNNNDKQIKEIKKKIAEIKALYKYCIKTFIECISSGTKRSELLHTLEVNPRFKEFFIYKNMLDHDHNNIVINTLTHLLIYNGERFIAIPHGEETKKYYPTKVMNVRYDRTATCPKFIEFLKLIMNNDTEMMKFITTIAGLCLLKRKEEVAFIFHGYGYNGKSTLLQVIADIMGDYVREGNISLLTAREEEGKNPEFVASAGKHLVIIDEPTKVKIVGSLLKALISTGKRSARTLNARPQEYEKTFNLIISTNPKPIIEDDTIGTYRRLVIIPFTYSIPEDKVILDYHLELLKEREGIFNLFLTALEEYLRVRNIKKIMPEAVKRYTYGLIWERDHIKEFADRYLETAEGVNTPFKEIYEKYTEFCTMKGISPLSKKTVSELLERKKYASIVINRITYKMNCTIKDRPDLEGIHSDIDDDRITTTTTTTTTTATPKATDRTNDNCNTNNSNNNNTNSNNNNNNTNNKTAKKYILAETLQLVEYIQKNFVDYNGVYLCRRCNYTHTPAVLCGCEVRLEELGTISIPLQEDHELIQTLQELCWHANEHDYQEWIASRYPRTVGNNNNNNNNNSGQATADKQ